MFKHILVPLDGSNLSEASLVPAAILSEKFGAPVTLLHVIEQDAPSEVHADRHLTKPDEALEYLADIARRSFSAEVNVRTHVHTAPVSDVTRSIVEHARTEFQPDLIVICTHGKSGLRDVLFGNIAQQVVAQGETPLMLIKPVSPRFKLEKILVPLDPDSAHDDSLPFAESLAQPFDAELHLLSVIPTFGTLAGEQAAAGNLMPVTAQAFLDMKEENARRDLQEHAAALREKGLGAGVEIARGDPVALIVKTAETATMDLIILSTHRRKGMGAFWARSVASKVAQRTKTPLLLIPLAQNE
ncbi:MAG TPA: universal stress protein [Anaerolineales bacterium]|nr:universal stress protein [Anaerolineales bacterium]